MTRARRFAAPQDAALSWQRLLSSAATTLVVLALWAASFSTQWSSVSLACTTGGGIRIAGNPSGPWYEGSAPPLSGQVEGLTRCLYPGASGRLVVYVKNLRSAPGVPSIAIAGLVDSGGELTPPERRVESPDVGDLSAATRMVLTYSSSLRPSEQYVVASGTLLELAAGGRTFIAPIRLQAYSPRSAEIGVWRIDLAVPATADNRIQGDKTSCSVIFGLTQGR